MHALLLLFSYFIVSELGGLSIYLPYLIMITSVKPVFCNKATLHERERVGGSRGHHVSLCTTHSLSSFSIPLDVYIQFTTLHSFLLFQHQLIYILLLSSLSPIPLGQIPFQAALTFVGDSP